MSEQHDIERRYFAPSLRIEKRAEGAPPRIVGHAAVFDQLSEDFGGWREKIAKGAFSQTIEHGDVRALWNHNPDHVLGRNKAGTLELAEDAEGLAIDIAPPDTSIGRDLIVSIERGDVSQMSFGFRTLKEEWDDTDPNLSIRTLLEVELFDVSPVTFAAYPQTDVAVRELRALQAARKATMPIGVLLRELSLIERL